MSRSPILKRPTVHHYLSFLWYGNKPKPEEWPALWKAVLALLDDVVNYAAGLVPALKVLEGQLHILRSGPSPSPWISRRLLSPPELAFHTSLGGGKLGVMLRAHQEADSLVLHWLWFYDGEAPISVFTEQIQSHLWHPRVAQVPLLGESVYLTAVVEEEMARAMAQGSITDPVETGYRTLARQILQQWMAGDPLGPFLNPVGLQLPVGRLYPDLLVRAPSAGPAILHAVLFYPNIETEDSAEVGRLVYEELPLLELYRHKLHAVYEREYWHRIRPTLDDGQRQLLERLRDILRALGGTVQKGNSLVLLQRALVGLAKPYFPFSAALAEAEELHQTALVNLENVERALRRIGGEATLAPLAEPLKMMCRQMEVDLAYGSNLASQVRDAINALRTRADILEAGYERRLGIIVAVLGTALAAGQVLSDSMATVLWHWLTAAPPEAQPSNLALMLIRIFAMVVSGLLTLLAIWLAERVRRWE